MNQKGLRITSTGMTVLAAGFSFVVLGYVLGYQSLTIAGAAVLLAVVFSAASTLSVPNLDVARVIEPQRVARGNPAHGLVSVTNPQSRRSKSCAAIETVGDRVVQVAVPSLGARKSIAVSYDLATQRRGELIVGPLSIQRRDPFGFFEANRLVGEKVTVLVEPNISALDPRPAGRLRHLEGPRSDKATQGTMTFHSLREYTLGDDIRRVHWRSSARTGTLMVKENVDTSLPSTVVVLDTNAAHYKDDLFEDAVDVAASVVAASQGRNFPVRFLTTSGSTLLVRAGQRGQELRDELASLNPDAIGAMHRATGEVLRCHDHDTIVVIAGALSMEDLVQVSSMARRFTTAILVTLRPVGGTTTQSPMWNAGMHLDGDTALSVMTRWQFGGASDGGQGSTQ
jgi:uncharacterized protein (DUF58 family)